MRNPLSRHLPLALHDGQRLFWPWLLALAVWLLAKMALPSAMWLWGDGVFPPLAALGVVLHFTATVLALAATWSAGRIAATVAVVALVTWAAEFVGSTTGFPFGDYAYTSLLQPQIGHVPLVIPLAWMMMLAPSWAVAELLTGQSRPGWQRALVFAAVSALAMTAWDLYLDPQMVSFNLWTWDQPFGYFGIPWTNYLGWLLVAFVLGLLIRPTDLPLRRLLLIYTLTWAFQAIGLGVLWGQPGPAVVGFVVMGAFTVLAWRRLP